jgi:hypothetical protein
MAQTLLSMRLACGSQRRSAHSGQELLTHGSLLTTRAVFALMPAVTEQHDSSSSTVRNSSPLPAVVTSTAVVVQLGRLSSVHFGGQHGSAG